MHGCFPAGLHGSEKFESPGCWFCGATIDDLRSTLFEWDAVKEKTDGVEEVTAKIDGIKNGSKAK